LDKDRRWISTGPDQGGRIRTGTPAETFSETESVLRRLKGPGFILSAGCVVSLDTPSENIDAAVLAARTPRPDRDQG
jgi:uroporphyrinogen-III decarboxylase